MKNPDMLLEQTVNTEGYVKPNKDTYFLGLTEVALRLEDLEFDEKEDTHRFYIIPAKVETWVNPDADAVWMDQEGDDFTGFRYSWNNPKLPEGYPAFPEERDFACRGVYPILRDFRELSTFEFHDDLDNVVPIFTSSNLYSSEEFINDARDEDDVDIQQLFWQLIEERFCTPNLLFSDQIYHVKPL